jgi:excisionase family DNA binding protein
MVKEPLRDYEAAAAWLGVPLGWLKQEVREGRAPHVRLGKYVRFSQAHLDRLVAEREVPGPPGSRPGRDQEVLRPISRRRSEK